LRSPRKSINIVVSTASIARGTLSDLFEPRKRYLPTGVSRIRYTLGAKRAAGNPDDDNCDYDNRDYQGLPDALSRDQYITADRGDQRASRLRLRSMRSYQISNFGRGHAYGVLGLAVRLPWTGQIILISDSVDYPRFGRLPDESATAVAWLDVRGEWLPQNACVAKVYGRRTRMINRHFGSRASFHWLVPCPL
jgi:hypothetical protein